MCLFVSKAVAIIQGYSTTERLIIQNQRTILRSHFNTGTYYSIVATCNNGVKNVGYNTNTVLLVAMVRKWYLATHNFLGDVLQSFITNARDEDTLAKTYLIKVASLITSLRSLLIAVVAFSDNKPYAPSLSLTDLPRVVATHEI